MIGLGQMGQGMAKNLAEKFNGPFYVYDINPSALDKFVDAYPKAKAAASPADLADKASTVITMLPEANHVQQVYDAMLDAVDQDSVLVDSSTIDTEVAQQVAANVMKIKNAKAFDAPVSGGMYTDNYTLLSDIQLTQNIYSLSLCQVLLVPKLVR